MDDFETTEKPVGSSHIEGVYMGDSFCYEAFDVRLFAQDTPHHERLLQGA